MRHFLTLAIITIFTTTLYASDVDAALSKEMDEHLASQMHEIAELQKDLVRDRERLIRDLERVKRRYERQDDVDSVGAVESTIEKLKTVPDVSDVLSAAFNDHFNGSSTDTTNPNATTDLLLDLRTAEERRQDDARSRQMARWDIRCESITFLLNGPVDENELMSNGGNKYLLSMDQQETFFAHVLAHGGNVNLSQIVAEIAPNTVQTATIEKVRFTNLSIEGTDLGSPYRYSPEDNVYDVTDSFNLYNVYRDIVTAD